MENIFGDIEKNLEDVIKLLENVDKAITSTPEGEDQIMAASEAAKIDLDNAMEPPDKLHPTLEDAKDEDKTVTKFEEALAKKIEEMLNG